MIGNDDKVVPLLARHAPELRMDNIPHHMHGAIARYLLWGIEPGSFLQSIFTNDLKGSAQRADHINTAHLLDYVYMLFTMPGNSQGDHQRYAEWVERGGLLGRCPVCGIYNGIEDHKVGCPNRPLSSEELRKGLVGNP